MQQKFMEVLKMSEIERINRYIERTKVKESVKNEMKASEWISISKNGSVLEAIALAFNYGRAKGYRAAMSERKAVRG